MIVVDSSVWIDFFHGVNTQEVERLDGLLGVTPLAIGDLVLVEVTQGFRTDQMGPPPGSCSAPWPCLPPRSPRGHRCP